MSGLLFDGLHRGLGTALDLRDAQHRLTVSNIVNADTPGYRARVMDFDKAIGAALDDIAQGEELSLDPEALPIEELEPEPWVVDGNSVVAEKEMERLISNSIEYNAIAGGLSRRLALLRFAANDGR